jgi:tRNA-splicing ligase RtcB
MYETWFSEDGTLKPTTDIVGTNKGCIVKTWTKGVLFEDHAKAQLANVAKLPFIFKHVVATSDVHAGRGSTVGSVVATQNAIIPSAVGSDISCGMLAMNTEQHVEGRFKDLEAVFKAISNAVPHGRTDNGGSHDRGAWHDLPERVSREWETNLKDKYDAIIAKHPKARAFNTVNHLGTLGTGNHFLELCLDENDFVWIMLHSGSRGMGAKLGSYFSDLAKNEMKKWFIELPDYELSYLPRSTEGFDDYINVVNLCNEYATANRFLMLQSVLDVLHLHQKEELIDCHHNFVAWENHFGQNVLITRKGAVRARKGDLLVLPGSMGTKSYICKGLGNQESYNSASHGAGRAMSRTEATRRFTVKDHIAATEGVVCRKDSSVIDETPAAYKDINLVLKAQEDLIEPVHTLKQFICLKG